MIGGVISTAKVSGVLWRGNEDEKIVAIILGGFLGLIVGFLFAIWTNGVVAAILNIDANLQYLADKEKAKG